MTIGNRKYGWIALRLESHRTIGGALRVNFVIDTWTIHSALTKTRIIPLYPLGKPFTV